MTDDLITRLRAQATAKSGTAHVYSDGSTIWFPMCDEAADALEAQARRIAELEAERDKANQATKDWLSATADEKLENKGLRERVSGLIQEGLMLVGKVEQRDARIAELKAALKPFVPDTDMSEEEYTSVWNHHLIQARKVLGDKSD